ncbi:molybdopterin molybdenumtransferase MoeA [Polymorphobacter multimanifer]|uniref:Molybdopterin molybdenumtransferase n=1 Tax=Polymorphobacter multimanifer TaxID=1070431 RepID=A0A841LBE8_9SPHN|nr:molybdopterin molybdotransferase [Polymorphobacter multimanifer]GGI81270.1 molybdopterin molybdenumtransferase MoeA [Polymorphobacter multimanifer]
MIRATVKTLGSEIVPVASAAGRVTASPVHAGADTPRFPASAMDGYAVASHDLAVATLAAPVLLPLGPMVPAGTTPPPLARGTAVPIATGAPVPPGADAVVMRETATLYGDRVAICRPAAPGHNVRAIGEDCSTGSLVLAAGVRIPPDAVGVLTAFGIRHVGVRRQPCLALLATGSELGPGDERASGAELVDSNSPMIAACAAAAGLACTLVGRVADSPAALDAALATALAPGSGDIILSTGGVSVGRFDLVRDRLEALGASVLFHGIAMRPGKPLLFALLPDGRPYFGLPGTPLAALVAFRFFVAAALRQMLGLPPETGIAVHEHPAGRPGITLFLRGRRGRDSGKGLVVDTDLDQRSHILHSLLDADCWLRIDDSDAAAPVARCYPRELLLG